MPLPRSPRNSTSTGNGGWSGRNGEYFGFDTDPENNALTPNGTHLTGAVIEQPLGNRLLDGEPITALPAIADQTHPLIDYFDSGFYRACFVAWQHRDEALQAVRLDRKRFEESPEYQALRAKFDKPNRQPGSQFADSHATPWRRNTH